MSRRVGKYKLSNKENIIYQHDVDNSTPNSLAVGGGYGSTGCSIAADGDVQTDGSLKVKGGVHFNDGTPIAMQSGANQIALTDSTGGSAGNETLAAVGATNGSDVSGAINDNFAKTAVLLNEIRQCLVDVGLIKGAA